MLKVEGVYLQLRFNSLLRRHHLHHHLARIHSIIQIHQTLRRRLQPPFHNMLLALDLALRQPLGQILQRIRVLLGVVEHDVALHFDSLRL